MKKFCVIYFIFLCTIITAQKKDKNWLLVDSANYKDFSIQDKYLVDSILPLYHKATEDSIKLKHVIFLANTLGDEKLWPRYNRLALQMAIKGGDGIPFQIYKTYALNNIAYELSILKNDSKGAQAIYEDIFKIQTKLNDLTGLAATTNNLANIFKKQGQIDKAIEWHLKSLAIKEKNNDQLGVGTSLNNLGSIYKDQGDHASAVNCFSKALKLFEKLNEKRQMAISLNNLGRVYQAQGDITKALENYKKAQLLFEVVGERQSQALTLNNIGEIYEDQGDTKTALQHYYQSKKIREHIGDEIGIGHSLLFIASAYNRMGQKDSAITLLTRSCKILEVDDNKQSLAQSYTSLGDVYYGVDDLANAEVYLKRSLKIAKDFGYPYLIKDPSFILYKLYRKQNKVAQSLEMYELHIKMRDSLERTENKRAVLRQQFKSEYDKKVMADSVAAANVRLIEQNKHDHEIARQKLFTYGGVVGFILMLLVAFVSFRAFKNKQQANREIMQQKHIIEEKQKEILDSINYAKRIQYTLLAHDEFLKQNLGEHFVLFKPKDIVSGDFYWATSVGSGQKAEGSRFYLAVCDSTGHGVPGAFMSLLNISFLNEAINEKGILEPHDVLNYVRRRLIDSISKDEQKDGFDGALICIDKSAKTVSYSSANTSPLLYSNGELLELPYDKMPVGQGERMNSFTLHKVDHNEGDILYIGTDGYVDQFGGKDGKKFKYRRLCDTLRQNAALNLNAQKNVLELTFNDWKGNLDQVDDVLIIGVKL